MHSNNIDVWESGGFRRDSMIHALGSLAEQMLDYAARDPALVRQLEAPGPGAAPQVEAAQGGPELDEPNGRHHDDPPVVLFEAGLGSGAATLYARPSLDEFVVCCQHASFRAVISAGFDAQRRRLLAVCVSSFEGDARDAAVWARAFSGRLANAQLGSDAAPASAGVH